MLATSLVPLALVLAGAAAASRQDAPSAAGAVPADLVLRGGKIVTVDDANPEVRALAARGGRIVFLGGDAGVAAYVGADTRVVDLAGRLALPGFIEGHGHFLGIGDARLQLDLMHAASWEEIVAMVGAAVKEARPGELIRGRGWHQDKWKPAPEPQVEGLPVHDALSAVSPDNPVVLTHASGHASFANAKAMAMAGIDARTADPPGGQIVRDEKGEAIGAFRETAARLLSRAMADATPPSPRRQAELAIEELLSKGVTSFQDAGSSFRDLELFEAMVADGSMGVRLWVLLREANSRLRERLPRSKPYRMGDARLTLGGIKHGIDGALGSHGAWLLAPYADLPSSSGLNTTPVELIEESAEIALEHRLQLCVHAIGDRANRETLDLFERALAGVPDGKQRRWRVEHAQHLHPDDVPRFAELGVVASMQGVHCTSDAVFVPERLGAERSKSGAYPWRALIDSGAVVSNGTDAPVEDVDPLACFHSSVTRRVKDGSIFHPEQRMTRAEALRSYTRNAAYAAFEEDIKGSLEVGKLADVTVLSRDVMTCPEAEILEAQVVLTIVGGEVAYAAE